MDLSPEERQRIYEEEKARLGVRRELEAPAKRKRIVVWSLIAAAVLIGGLTLYSLKLAQSDARAAAAAKARADFLVKIEAVDLYSKIYRSAQTEFLRSQRQYSWDDLAEFAPGRVSTSGDGSYYVRVSYRGPGIDGKLALKIALCRVELIAGIPTSKCPKQ